MKRWIAMLLAVCLMLGLCACGSADNNDSVQDTTAAPVETTAAAPEETEEETQAQPAGTVYTVTVVDEGGNPVAGAMVQICLETCMPGVTNENGVAEFATEEADYKASMMSMPEGYEYATEQTEFYFEGGYEVTIVLKAVA